MKSESELISETSQTDNTMHIFFNIKISMPKLFYTLLIANITNDIWHRKKLIYISVFIIALALPHSTLGWWGRKPESNTSLVTLGGTHSTTKPSVSCKDNAFILFYYLCFNESRSSYRYGGDLYMTCSWNWTNTYQFCLQKLCKYDFII